VSNLGNEIEIDVANGLLAAFEAYETPILEFAKTQIDNGETSAAKALEAGFKAKVPLAGGAIASAIDTAFSQFETQENATLKSTYDQGIAWLKAKVSLAN
jgi:hypothetical protein